LSTRLVSSLSRPALSHGVPLAQVSKDAQYFAGLEFRVPIELPILTRFNSLNDLGVCVFAEWGSEGERGVGFGGRAAVAGIPLKYDIVLNRENEVKTMFSIATDFQL